MKYIRDYLYKKGGISYLDDEFNVGRTDYPKDTQFRIVVSAFDSNGQKTPTHMESMLVIYKKGKMFVVRRGVEGSAQAHPNGAMIEYTDDWNLLSYIREVMFFNRL